jgi:hypothetical protein
VFHNPELRTQNPELNMHNHERSTPQRLRRNRLLFMGLFISFLILKDLVERPWMPVFGGVYLVGTLWLGYDFYTQRRLDRDEGQPRWPLVMEMVGIGLFCAVLLLRSFR